MSMRSILIVGVLLLRLSLGNAQQSLSSGSTNSKRSMMMWRLPVASLKSTESQSAAELKLLCKTLGQTMPLIVDKNPVCCFWVEIDPWMPSPGHPGFIIIIQSGGAIIRATNTVQLKLAIDKLGQIKESRTDGVYLPADILITNYPQ